jgi:predicted RNA-binding Zn-ribbon protein involved in translation (DUF1610 family)
MSVGELDEGHDPTRKVAVVARCDDCGDVRPALGSCTLLFCSNVERYTVAYPCPICGRRNSTRCTRATVVQFVAAGLKIHSWSLPDELADPARLAPEGARGEILALLRDGAWDELVARSELRDDQT